MISDDVLNRFDCKMITESLKLKVFSYDDMFYRNSYIRFIENCFKNNYGICLYKSWETDEGWILIVRKFLNFQFKPRNIQFVTAEHD